MIDTMRSALSKNVSITILTGAGISAESGLETFRGAGGLWYGHRVEDVATPQAFAQNPDLVHEFYNMRRHALLAPDIKPNAAHLALARLEKEWRGSFTLVTQNIDDLHERAGSANPVHMHGEALKALCTNCTKTTAWRDELTRQSPCPSCAKSGFLRPDIVWFGEMPYHMDSIDDALSDCGLFVSIGTSGNVYPAAGFVQHARSIGAHCIEMNLDPAANAFSFHESIQGPAGTTVPELVESLLS